MQLRGPNNENFALRIKATTEAQGLRTLPPFILPSTFPLQKDSPAPFRRCESRFCPPFSPVVLEEVGPEIDTPDDLALCRSIAAQKAE